MIITRIEAQPKRKERWNLFTDDGFLIALSSETILTHHIKSGMFIDDQLLEELRKTDTLQFAKSLAADCLSRGPHSRMQVYEYLIKRSIDETSAQEAVSLFEEYGYIDDPQFAADYANSLRSEKGNKVILGKLLEKGIDKSLALSTVDSLGSRYDDALSVAQKTSGKLRSYPIRMQKQKLLESLIRKGFTKEEAEHCYCVLDPPEEEEQSRILSGLYENLVRKYAHLDPQQQKRKISEALYRKGYDWDAIRSLFQEEE